MVQQDVSGPGFTRSQEVWTMLAVTGVSFLCGVSESMAPVLYPEQAEKKGVTASQYGLVFGTYALVAFVSSPVIGKYMDKLGVKFVTYGGLFVAGLGCSAFGFLHFLDSCTTFLVLSFVTMTLQALGTCAVVSTDLTLIGIVFPNAISYTLSLVEAFYGIGELVGPLLAGILMEVGGYWVPFLAVGVLLVASSALLICVLPNLDDGIETREPIQLLSLLKIRALQLDILSITVMSFTSGFYFAILEPHLRQLHLSHVIIGVMFSVSGLSYSLSAPLVGKVCDTWMDPRKMMLLGCVLGIAGLVLIGPAPFVPWKTSETMAYIGLVCVGLSASTLTVASIVDGFHAVLLHGLPDNTTTYGIVSGTITSANYVGMVLGPSVAGVLYDNMGFRMATLVPMAFYVCVFVLVLWAMYTSPHAVLKDDTKRLSSDVISCDTERTDKNHQYLKYCEGSNDEHKLINGGVKSLRKYGSDESEMKKPLLDSSQ